MYSYVLLLEIHILQEEGSDYISWFNLVTFLYLSQVKDFDFQRHMSWSVLCVKGDNVRGEYSFWNGSGGFGAVKCDSTHHFFGNACTKSGPLRFSQFSGC